MISSSAASARLVRRSAVSPWARARESDADADPAVRPVPQTRDHELRIPSPRAAQSRGVWAPVDVKAAADLSQRHKPGIPLALRSATVGRLTSGRGRQLVLVRARSGCGNVTYSGDQATRAKASSIGRVSASYSTRRRRALKPSDPINPSIATPARRPSASTTAPLAGHCCGAITSSRRRRPNATATPMTIPPATWTGVTLSFRRITANSTPRKGSRYV